MTRVAACDGTRSALRPSRGSDRRLEGEPAEGWRSRRPAVTVAVEAPAMAAECGDRREAHGRLAARKSRQPAAACSGAQNRRNAGAARQPRGPRQVPESPRARALEEARRGLLGPEVNRPPGRREAPAYPSHPRGFPQGRTARATIRQPRKTDEPGTRTASIPRDRRPRAAACSLLQMGSRLLRRAAKRQIPSPIPRRSPGSTSRAR